MALGLQRVGLLVQSRSMLLTFPPLSAWSLGYLFFNLRTALRAPRHPFALLLAGSASGTAALYGSEYFFLQS
jgi:hypothetical protein